MCISFWKFSEVPPRLWASWLWCLALHGARSLTHRELLVRCSECHDCGSWHCVTQRDTSWGQRWRPALRWHPPSWHRSSLSRPKGTRHAGPPSSEIWVSGLPRLNAPMFSYKKNREFSINNYDYQGICWLFDARMSKWDNTQIWVNVFTNFHIECLKDMYAMQIL